MDNNTENGYEDLDQEQVAESLTNWKNPPKLSDLKADLTSANQDHTGHVEDVRRWLDNLEGTGSAAVKKVAGRSAVVPKVIQKQAEWRYTALSEPFLSTDDVFNVAPKTYEDKESAEQNSLLLNYQFNTMVDKVAFFDTYIRTAVDEGSAVLKVGWKYEEGMVTVEKPVMDLVPVEDPQLAAEMVNNGEAPFQEVQIGVEYVEEMGTVKNHPTVEVLEYSKVIIDPTCSGDIDKANFVIYCFDTSKSDLKKDGRYSNLDAIKVSDASTLDLPDEEVESFEFKDDSRKILKAYEYWGYWDIDGTGVTKPFVATWVGSTLIRMEENPFPDKKLPFVKVQYLPKRFSNYGIPDGAIIEDNQKIIGAVTRGMVDIMGRSANGQIGRKKGALDPVNRAKYDRGEDYEFNPHDGSPEHNFYLHKYPEIPRSAEYMINFQNQEADSLTGIKSFSGGISGEALGRTATGIRTAMDAASKRELGILRRLAEGVKKVGRKFMAMNAVFLDEEEIVRVTNDVFVPIRRDDLGGYYDVTLTISTAEADNDKAKELSFMLQTLGQTIPEDITRMIMADIAKLRKMPMLAKNLEEYQPAPDPIQQKMQELEIAKLEQEIAKTQAETRHIEAQAQLNLAKVQTEGAKAKDLDSAARSKQLDAVEKETGTTQERELEKLDRQHGNQLDLKAADAALKAQEKLGELQNSVAPEV